MGVLIQCELCKSILPEAALFCAQCGSALSNSTVSIIDADIPDSEDILSYPGMQDALMLVDQLPEEPVALDPRMALAADVDEVMQLDDPDLDDADALDDDQFNEGSDLYSEELFPQDEGVDQWDGVPMGQGISWLEEIADVAGVVEVADVVDAPPEPAVAWLEEVPSLPDTPVPSFEAISVGQMGGEERPRITAPLPAVSQEMPVFSTPTASRRSALSELVALPSRRAL